MVSLDVCWYFERTGRIAGLVLHEMRLRDKEGDQRRKEKRQGEEKALMWLNAQVINEDSMNLQLSIKPGLSAVTDLGRPSGFKILAELNIMTGQLLICDRRVALLRGCERS